MLMSPALASLDECIGLKPAAAIEANCLSERAHVHREAERWQAAIADLDQAVGLTPEEEWLFRHEVQ